MQLPRLALIALLFIGNGCKKSSVVPVAPIPPAISSGIDSCNATLALLLAPSLPPVYAPLLVTSQPQLSEVSYTYGTPAAVYKSILIQFNNLPVTGNEQATTADYGKYKICTPDATGTCLQTCVAGVCSTEATTVTWSEEVPIPDTLVTSDKAVFTVYTASCVSPSRRMAQNVPNSPTDASNPECGAWTSNIVLHSQNANPVLETMLTNFRNLSLDRQSLAGDLATGGQQFLANSSSTTPTGDTPTDALIIMAHNAIQQQPVMAGLLNKGALEDLHNAAQSATPSMTLAGMCFIPKPPDVNEPSNANVTTSTTPTEVARKNDSETETETDALQRKNQSSSEDPQVLKGFVGGLIISAGLALGAYGALMIKDGAYNFTNKLVDAKVREAVAQAEKVAAAAEAELKQAPSDLQKAANDAQAKANVERVRKVVTDKVAIERAAKMGKLKVAGGSLFAVGSVALIVIGSLFMNGNIGIGLAGGTEAHQGAWTQVIQQAGDTYLASMAKTAAVLDSINAYLAE